MENAFFSRPRGKHTSFQIISFQAIYHPRIIKIYLLGNNFKYLTNERKIIAYLLKIHALKRVKFIKYITSYELITYISSNSKLYLSSVSRVLKSAGEKKIVSNKYSKSFSLEDGNKFDFLRVLKQILLGKSNHRLLSSS